MALLKKRKTESVVSKVPKKFKADKNLEKKPVASEKHVEGSGGVAGIYFGVSVYNFIST